MKYIVISLLLLFSVGCNHKKPKKQPMEKKHLDLAKSKVKQSEEFIPEHLRKSKIEVVKRN